MSSRSTRQLKLPLPPPTATPSASRWGIPWTPRAHQKTAIRWLVEHPEAALLLDPGLGKTTSTLAALKLLRRSKAANKTLIIAPKRVCRLVWSHDGEIGKWKDFNGLRVVLLHGPRKEQVLQEDADLYVINPDGLPWLMADKRIDQLLKAGVDTLVIDELSKFKHPQSRRFKLLKPYLGRFKRRWGLTGSPATNGLMDLFGEAYVLDLGRALGKYITHFRSKYFMPTGFGGYTWVPQEGAEERIYQALEPLALSMRAKDHLPDLPELVEEDLWVDLPDECRKTYDDMEEELIAEFKGEVVTALSAASASMKCRQIASGGLYAYDQVKQNELPTRRSLLLHDAKTEALKDLVDELQGAPLLVAYEFHHDLERIRAALGEVPAINGQTTEKQLLEIVRAWNAGKLEVLCGHPAAMGHGLNLQSGGCCHVAWYTVPWDLELYDQTNARVHRQGASGSHVFVHRILARKTLDVAVCKALGSKQRTQSALFNALQDVLADR